MGGDGGWGWLLRLRCFGILESEVLEPPVDSDGFHSGQKIIDHVHWTHLSG